MRGGVHIHRLHRVGRGEQIIRSTVHIPYGGANNGVFHEHIFHKYQTSDIHREYVLHVPSGPLYLSDNE